jgi:hypothetical protein
MPIARPATTSKRATAGLMRGLYRGIIRHRADEWSACSDPLPSVGCSPLWQGCV